MVGINQSLFIRSSLPSELICDQCKLVLRDPYSCGNCSQICCASCLNPSNKCSHKSAVKYTLIYDKINELFIKCKYYTHGCLKITKLKDLLKHEEICEFNEVKCVNKDCIHENCKERLAEHVIICPLEHVKEEVRGGEINDNFIKKDSHECSKWLQTVVESMEIKEKVLIGENDDLKKEHENCKQKHEKKCKDLNFEINEMRKKNEEIIKNMNITKIDYEKKIAQLEEESAYKMKVIHETKDARMNNYLKKTDGNFKNLEENLNTKMKKYIDSLQNGMGEYINKLDVKTNDIVSKKKIVNNVKNPKIGKLNDTILTCSTNNTTLLNNSKY